MFFKKLNKLFFLKIPSTISVFYFKNSNILLFKNNFKNCSIMLNKKLHFLLIKNKIIAFNNVNKELSTSKKKQFVNFKKLFLYSLNKFLWNTKTNSYNRLNLNGIGYRVFKTKYNSILVFKLGFSHLIYFKLKLKVLILKDTNLFIISNLYKKSKKILPVIQKLKYPEPYKGKGIFVNNQRIKLKKGKKI